MDQALKLKPSTQVHGARYDPDTQRLTLDLNGGTFAYHQVDAMKATDFANAESHGDYFHANIRGKHEFTRVR